MKANGLFIIVLIAAAAVVALTAARLYPLALTVGVGAGAAFFLRGMAAGGGLGNARQFGRQPADVNTRIGVCFAAAGIAAGAIGHEPLFPLSFRVFYGVCLALGVGGALLLAGKAATGGK